MKHGRFLTLDLKFASGMKLKTHADWSLLSVWLLLDGRKSERDRSLKKSHARVEIWIFKTLGILAISFWNSGNLLQNIRVFSSDQLFGCLTFGPSLAESIRALGIRANGGTPKNLMWVPYYKKRVLWWADGHPPASRYNSFYAAYC
jgi:hypothetical protein